MQNPEAILAAAKSGGGLPATWRVLRPKGSYPVGAGCLGGFIAFFIVFFGTIVAFILHGVSQVSSNSISGFNASDPASFFESFLPLPLPVLIAGGVGLIIVGGVLSAMRAISRVPYSYFVFTPEGAVQATGPQKITAIDYSAIDMINTRISVNRYTTTNQSTGLQTTNTTVSVWGELHYSNGRTVRFRPSGRFGSAESIIQRLINGHAEYKAMVGAQRPARSGY
jgi:hypothetical protein